MYVCMYVSMYVCMYVYMYVYVCMYVCICLGGLVVIHSAAGAKGPGFNSPGVRAY